MRTPAMANVRVPEQFVLHNAPDPVRQSDFVNQGKPWGRSYQQIAIAQSIAPYHAVMEDEFGRTPTVVAPNHIAGISALPGSQLSFVERANINKPPATAYGSLFQLAPSSYYGFVE